MRASRPTTVLLLLLAAIARPAVAAEPAYVTDEGFAPGTLGPEWKPIDPARLDSMRGGFQTPTGMTLSFGIERVVQVNGELIATTRVNIPDVARMTAEQATELARLNEGLIVQIGPGNHFEPDGNLQGVVIQNGLDGQDIRTLTTLNIGVDTLGSFQAMNSQAALRDALINAVRPP